MMKIGVFDSGIGGITVLTELKKRFGFMSYVYLGDTAHVPYGGKSPNQIRKLSVVCAQILKERNVDALVVACNTASSLAFEAIHEVMGSTPVFGVVGPGIEAALSAFDSLNRIEASPPILVFATRATVMSKAYGKALRGILEFYPGSQGRPFPIIEQACPLLVPMIEEGWIDHPILHQTLAEYVKPYGKMMPGVALLGCTHYPWIHSAFERALPGWKVVNSAHAVVQCIEKSELFTAQPLSRSEKGKIEWIWTDANTIPPFAQTLMDATESSC